MTASSPPPMTPRELVGVTQASTFWSSIEPRTMSTSGFSSKLVRHDSIIFVLMSTRMILTDIGFPSRSPALVPLELDQIFLALLLGGVDHIFVVVELGVDVVVTADAVAAVEAVGRLRQAVGDLVILFRLAQGDADDRHEGGALLARRGVEGTGARRVAEVDAA